MLAWLLPIIVNGVFTYMYTHVHNVLQVPECYFPCLQNCLEKKSVISIFKLLSVYLFCNIFGQLKIPFPKELGLATDTSVEGIT